MIVTQPLCYFIEVLRYTTREGSRKPWQDCRVSDDVVGFYSEDPAFSACVSPARIAEGSIGSERIRKMLDGNDSVVPQPCRRLGARRAENSGRNADVWTVT